MKHFPLPILFVASMFLSSWASGQYATDTMLAGDSLQVEIEKLKEKVLESMTNPYHFATEAEIDKAFKKLSATVEPDSVSKRDYAFAVGEFLTVFRDSHSYLSFSGFMSNYKKEDGQYLDIQVASLIPQDEDGNMMLYVTRNSHGFNPGDRIVSINGVGVGSIWYKCYNIANIEGNSVKGKIRMADIIFSGLLPALVKIESENEVVYVDGVSGEKRKKKLMGIPYPELKKKQKELKKSPEGKKFQNLRLYEKDSLVVMRIGSFAQGSEGKYVKFIKQSFKTIKREGYDKLVIDLRNNGGGSAQRMEFLMRHLTEDTIHVPATIIAKASSTSKSLHAKRYKGFNKWMLDNFFKENEQVQNYLRIVRLDSGAVDTINYTQPSDLKVKTVYDGKTALLINGRSGSASVSFASVFRSLDRGIILGEECLGPMAGTWGNPSSIRLSYSQLPIILSTIRFLAQEDFTNNPAPISPDTPINYTQEDLLKERDLELEWLRENEWR